MNKAADNIFGKVGINALLGALNLRFNTVNNRANRRKSQRFVRALNKCKIVEEYFCSKKKLGRYILLLDGIIATFLNVTLLAALVQSILLQVEFCKEVLDTDNHIYLTSPKKSFRVFIFLIFFIPALILNILLSLFNSITTIPIALWKAFLGISVYVGIGKNWVCLATGALGSFLISAFIAMLVFGIVIFSQPHLLWLAISLTAAGASLLVVLLLSKIVFGAISLLKKRVEEERGVDAESGDDGLHYGSNLGIADLSIFLNLSSPEDYVEVDYNTMGKLWRFVGVLYAGSIVENFIALNPTNLDATKKQSARRHLLFLDGLINLFLHSTLLAPIMRLIITQTCFCGYVLKDGEYLSRFISNRRSRVAICIGFFIPALIVNSLSAVFHSCIRIPVSLWRTALGALVYIGAGKGPFCLISGVAFVGLAGFGLTALGFGIPMLACGLWSLPLWAPILITVFGAGALVVGLFAKIALGLALTCVPFIKHKIDGVKLDYTEEDAVFAQDTKTEDQGNTENEQFTSNLY